VLGSDIQPLIPVQSDTQLVVGSHAGPDGGTEGWQLGGTGTPVPRSTARQTSHPLHAVPQAPSRHVG
jgi:hypothetical protein